MKRIFVPFAAAVLTALPGPAPAAPGPSTAAVYAAGRCIVARDYGRALALLVALPLDDQAADLAQLRGSGAEPCAGGIAGASALLVRGAIAQALFMRDFGGFGRDPRSSAHLINLNLPVQDSAGGSRALDLYRWGDCVVRNNPGATQDLLASVSGSAEERAAIAELQPFMTPCMPFGTQLTTVYLTEARAVFAQSAYHTMYRYATGQLRVAAQSR